MVFKLNVYNLGILKIYFYSLGCMQITHHGFLPEHGHPLLDAVDSGWYLTEVVTPKRFLFCAERAVVRRRQLQVTAVITIILTHHYEKACRVSLCGGLYRVCK